MLGVSIDEMDDLDDIFIEENDGIKFIASKRFSDQYGTGFDIELAEGQFRVTRA